VTTAQGRPPAIDASRFPKKLWSDRHQPQGSHAHTPTTTIFQLEHAPHTRKLSCRALHVRIKIRYITITFSNISSHASYWMTTCGVVARLRYATLRPSICSLIYLSSMLKSVAMMGCSPCVLVSATLACRHPCVTLNTRLCLSGSGVLTSFDISYTRHCQ
jgi:hypothetical protein